jgi:hypothetical protein
MTVLGVLRWGGMIRRFDGERKLFAQKDATPPGGDGAARGRRGTARFLV